VAPTRFTREKDSCGHLQLGKDDRAVPAGGLDMRLLFKKKDATKRENNETKRKRKVKKMTVTSIFE
jgi:hypothetical protein